VTYYNRGFLRGGTDDQYPIYLLAAKGFAVFAFNNPKDVASIYRTDDEATEDAANARDFQDWQGRKSIESGLEAGIAKVFESAAIDRSRIGITGMSDGSATVQWALLNSHLFTAAAISNCCADEYMGNYVPPNVGREMTKWGLPYAEDARYFYKPESLAQNSKTMDTPLLMQISQFEMLPALATVNALSAHSKPVEMYVYPNEYHNKWQPSHRAMIYERAVDWFEFWLQCKVNTDPKKAEQYGRWSELQKAAGIQKCGRKSG